jgi:ABC-type nitrate/sulfonate/bicarbonate transport system substrate-binding protein
MVNFRRVAAGLLAAALAILAVATDGAEAADKLRVGKAFPNPMVFVPADVGVAAGIFAKHGIEAEISGFGGEGRMIQAMTAGALDIGLGSGTGLSFVVKGVPYLGVGELYGDPTNLGIHVLAGSPIKRAEDLKGKLVSCSTAGSLSEWLIKELSVQLGWGPNGIKTVPLGGPEATLAALRTKQTDAGTSNVDTVLMLRGETRQLLSYSQYIKNFTSNVIYASNKIRAENPDAVRRFLAAWYETIAYMRANKTEAVKIAAKVMHMPEELTAQSYDIQMVGFSSDGRFDPRSLEYIKKSLMDMKVLESPPDMSKLYTEEFLPKKRPQS